jgi:isopentenyl diphosphate isomerase/L-lactate dehydrogenase-like FMN-dependent dehydrogenase
MRAMVESRRKFLRFVAASPLLAQVRGQAPPVTLTTAKDALKVMDFEEAAHKALPPAHWGYMASGVDDDLTLQNNLAAFKRIQLRPRRLVDVSKVDLSIELFGTTWETPIFLCPVGTQKMFHPEGEIAVARAARAKKSLQILSTVTTSSVEDVAKALGRPPWYQLYMPTTWDAAEKMVHRVEEAGCQALAWTIDLLGGRKYRDGGTIPPHRHPPMHRLSHQRARRRSRFGTAHVRGPSPNVQPAFGNLGIRRSSKEANQNEAVAQRRRQLRRCKTGA